MHRFSDRAGAPTARDNAVGAWPSASGKASAPQSGSFAVQGLSRKGGGEGCEVGFLERDEAAGELEEGEVVLFFL